MTMRLMTLALLVAITTPVWAEDTFSLTSGVDYTTGTYGGTTPTDILYVPVTGKYQADSHYLKLTVPYISVNSTGSVIRGVGKVKRVSSTRATTQSGLGDIIASAGYTLIENNGLLFNLVGNIKFATADADKNLGTGENDYSVQIDGFSTIENTTTFATVGYKIVGAPAGTSVNNINYATIGLSHKYTDKTSLGVALDAAQSSSELIPGTRELSVFVSQKLSNTLRSKISLMKGFSDSSPDYGGSIMLTWDT